MSQESLKELAELAVRTTVTESLQSMLHASSEAKQTQSEATIAAVRLIQATVERIIWDISEADSLPEYIIKLRQASDVDRPV